ncbi:MAG: Gfo/Idh/MocA family protein [Mycobacterium leprae]
MQPVRVGIIGLGAIGGRVARRFHQDPRTPVLFVCDANEALARQTAQELGGIAWSTDYKQMLQGDQVDLVYVGTPPRWHHPIALDVIAAGKHIMSEKPLALTLAQAADMTAKVEAAGLVSHVHLPLPYDPSIVEFGKLVRSGYLGDLRRVELHMVFPQWPRGWQSKTQNNFIGKREQGGPVREVGPHLFDVVLRNFGPVTRVRAEMEYPADPEACETGAFGMLELASGVHVTVNVLCGVARQESVDLTAYGTAGTLMLRHWSNLMGGKTGEMPSPLTVQDQDGATVPELLYGAIREGRRDRLSPFAQGLAVQGVLDAWERAAASGQWEPVIR